MKLMCSKDLTNVGYMSKEERRSLREKWRKQNEQLIESKFTSEFILKCEQIIILLGAFQYAMMGLKENLEAEGKFKHDVKYKLNNLSRYAETAFVAYHKAFGKCEDGDEIRLWLNDAMDTVNNTVEESIALEGSDRYLNICVCLYRLMKGRMDYVMANVGAYLLSRVLKPFFAQCEMSLVPLLTHDYKLDRVIEMNIDFEKIHTEGNNRINRSNP